MKKDKYVLSVKLKLATQTITKWKENNFRLQLAF